MNKAKIIRQFQSFVNSDRDQERKDVYNLLLLYGEFSFQRT